MARRNALNQAWLSGNEALAQGVFKNKGVEENEKVFLDGRKMGQS